MSETNDTTKKEKSHPITINKNSPIGVKDLTPYSPGLSGVFRYVRQKVSLKKKRFQEDGFDLDLAYVSPRLIATGMPSSGKEALIRNPKEEVREFLERYHKDHYFLYNLCEGREDSYPKELFCGRVCTSYGFADHQAPPFEKIELFCKEVCNWLRKDDKNVAVIHCKAGKGRTGLMTCAVLMYSGFKPTAQEAMDYYAVERTDDLKGVNIPSQRRYVEYFGEALNLYGGIPPLQGQKLMLKKLIINKAPKGGIAFSLKIRSNKVVIYNHRLIIPERKFFKEGERIEVSFTQTPEMSGDIHFEVRNKGGKSPFKFWLSTYFIRDCYQSLTKWELDKLWTDTDHKKCSEDFKVELFFEQTQKPQEVEKKVRIVKCDINFGQKDFVGTKSEEDKEVLNITTAATDDSKTSAVVSVSETVQKQITDDKPSIVDGEGQEQQQEKKKPENQTDVINNEGTIEVQQKQADVTVNDGGIDVDKSAEVVVDDKSNLVHPDPLSLEEHTHNTNNGIIGTIAEEGAGLNGSKVPGAEDSIKTNNDNDNTSSTLGLSEKTNYSAESSLDEHGLACQK